MDSEIPQVLKILHDADAFRADGFRKIGDCLPASIDPALLGIFQREIQTGTPSFADLVAEVSNTVKEHHLELAITDWPFENF